MDFGAQAPADLAWLRGVDAYTMGAYPQAEEEFRTAVRIDPGMADGWLGLHALRVDTTTALLRMFRHRDRFGEQRTRHDRTLNSWYWLGWWVQPVLETPRDLLLAHASHWLDGRHVPELDRALAGLPPVDADPQVRFLHACRAYLVKDWEQLVRHTDPLVDDPLLGIEAGLFGGMARVRLEMYGQAEPLLAAALMRCRSEQPQRKELRYWLARAREGTGRSAAALPLYRAVHRVDPAFMDTAARLAAIAEGDGYDDSADLAAITLTGAGQDAVDGPDTLDPLFGTEGRDLRLSDPDPTSPPMPSFGGSGVRGGPAARAPCHGGGGAHRPGTAGGGARGTGAHGRPGTGEAPGQGVVRAAQHGAAARRSGAAGAAAEAALRLLRPLRHGQDHGRPHPRPGLLRPRTARRRPPGGGSAGGPGRRVPRADGGEGQRADRLRARRGALRRRGLLPVELAVKANEEGDAYGDEALQGRYGDEALQVLLKRAEDNRDHLVVILVSYPEGMDRLLAANPGLSSRFTTRVDFPSYRPLELTRIGEVLAAENGDVWDEEALDELRSIAGHVVDQGWIDELGNGRFLRTLYEKSCAYRDLRLSAYPGPLFREDLATLRLPDLMQAYGEVLSGRGPSDPSGP